MMSVEKMLSGILAAPKGNRMIYLQVQGRAPPKRPSLYHFPKIIVSLCLQIRRPSIV